MLAIPASNAEEETADYDARLNGVHIDAPEPHWYAGTGMALTGRGFGAGLAESAQALEAGMEPIREAIPESIQSELFGAKGDDLKELEAQQSNQIRAIAETLRPNPNTTGMAGKTLEGIEGGIAQATAGSIVGGPAGAFATVGVSQGYAAYEDLIHQGVDPSTAREIAGLTGVVSGAGAVLPPAFGSSLAARIATGAAAQTALGAGMRGATSKILEDNGYKDMSQQYKMLDGWGMVGDAAMGAFFGAIHGGHAPETDHPFTKENVKPSDVDAAMAVHSAQQFRDSSPGVTADPAAARAHDMAMKTAAEQIMRDEPVDVNGIIDGEILARPEPKDFIKAWEEATQESGLHEISENLNDTASRLESNGIPTDELPSYEKILQHTVPTAPPIETRIVKTSEAVTPTGRAVPVDYAIVSAKDLIASNNDDLTRNMKYPQALQPRDRTRAASELQINNIMNPENFKPQLLGETAVAGDGTPIIGKEGFVESGNTRTIALRRAYAQNTPVATAYREFLKKQGYPIDGVADPVLVRINNSPMALQDRADFAAEANMDTKLRMSSTEQAMVDGKNITDEIMAKARAGDFMSPANREFVRSVIGNIASPGEIGNLITSDGRLSQDGLRRVRGAIVAKAYGDSNVVETLLESTESRYRAIGNALVEVAPDWAKLRSAISAQGVPAKFDLTKNMMEAIGIIERARQNKLGGLNIKDHLGQRDIFTGQGTDPMTEMVMAWFFRNSDFTRPTSQPTLTDQIRFYVDDALKQSSDANLFGEKGGVDVNDLISAARQKFQGTGTKADQGTLLGENVRRSGSAEDIRGEHGEGGGEEQRSGSDQSRPSDATGGTGAEPAVDVGGAVKGSPRSSTSMSDVSEGTQPSSESSSTSVNGFSERRKTRNMPFLYLKYATDLIPSGSAKRVSAGKWIDSDFIIDPESNQIQYQKSKNKETLLKQAQKNQPALVELIKKLTDGVDGARPYHKGDGGTRIKKDVERLDQKIGKKEGNAGAISDYLGGAVEVKSPEAMTEIVRRLHESGERIIEMEDMLSPTGNRNPYAYRAVHLQVELAKGFSAELQIIPESLALAKEDLHRVYEKYRTPEAQQKLKDDKAFNDEYEAARDNMRSVYQKSYLDFVNAGKSGEGKTLPEGQSRVSTDPAQAVIDQKPDIEVATPEGNFNGRDLLGQADVGVQDAAKVGDLFQVAVNCAMRNA